MKRIVKIGIKAILMAILLTVPVSSAVLADDGTIDMVVSPNVLNIESNGGSISVHTDIGYVRTAETILKVNGTPVYVYTFPDSRGNLVVKASITTVKGLVTAGEDAVFDLTYIINGETYEGSDTIAVIQVIPQKP